MPALADFLAGAETRLRDLLAFGLAVEAARPATPDAIQALRNKAEAELQAHALRVLHNQVETIRREAMEEQMRRVPRGLTLAQAILANLIALLVAGGLATLAWLASPHLG